MIFCFLNLIIIRLRLGRSSDLSSKNASTSLPTDRRRRGLFACPDAPSCPSDSFDPPWTRPNSWIAPVRYQTTHLPFFLFVKLSNLNLYKRKKKIKSLCNDILKIIISLVKLSFKIGKIKEVQARLMLYKIPIVQFSSVIIAYGCKDCLTACFYLFRSFFVVGVCVCTYKYISKSKFARNAERKLYYFFC